MLISLYHITFITEFFCLPTDSLLSSSRDSTYRDDDNRHLDELNTNGTIAKSSSCSSFLIDVLFRGILSCGKGGK